MEGERAELFMRHALESKIYLYETVARPAARDSREYRIRWKRDAFN